MADLHHGVNRTFGVFLYQIKVTHDAERAWILIASLDKPEHLEWREIRPDINPTTAVSWTIQNSGRTPARIVKIRLRFHFVDSLGEMPIHPDYGDGRCMLIDQIPTDGTFIAPGGNPQISTTFEGDGGQPGTPTQAQMDAVRSGKAFLIAYGSILYKDAFNRKHETRFCQIYNARRPNGAHSVINGWFSVGGPAKYNRTT